MHVPRRLCTITRSALVGAVATLVDLGLLAALIHAGIGPRVASPFALLAGVALQFVGNKRFAFRDRSRRWGPQAAWFLAIELGAFTLHAIGFDLLVSTTLLPPLLVRVAVSALVYFSFSLPLWSRLFRGAAGDGAAPVGVP